MIITGLAFVVFAVLVGIIGWTITLSAVVVGIVLIVLGLFAGEFPKLK